MEQYRDSEGRQYRDSEGRQYRDSGELVIGMHVVRDEEGGILPALAHADEITGAYTTARPIYQIFVSGPSSMRRIITEDEVRELRAAYSGRIIIHGAYIDNAWTPAAMHNIKAELAIASQMNGLGVVVHLGSGIAKNIESLKKLRECEQTLWFEINSAKPSEFTFETPSKLAAFFERVKGVLNDISEETSPRSTNTKPTKPTKLKIALMIDTAHLWACGVSMAEAGPAKRWLKGASKLSIPLGFHLNDTDTALGSGRDRHVTMGEGNIWGGGRTSGLLAILDFARKHRCPVIIEGGARREPIQDMKILSELGYIG